MKRRILLAGEILSLIVIAVIMYSYMKRYYYGDPFGGQRVDARP